MKMNKTVLAVFAIVLPLSAGIGSALSYFTANDSAVGGYGITVGTPDTEIEEKFEKWKKRITITNTGDVPVYVRARAFVVSPYTVTSANEDWTLGADGYYYYKEALSARVPNEGNPEEYIYTGTTPLELEIKGIPTNAVENDEFNVVVIYEKTSAVKDDGNGNAVPDWDFVLQEEDKVLSQDLTEKRGNS